MALEINDLRQPPVGAMYVSPRRLCITAAGEVCDEDDPRAVTLLVSAGGSIPATEAAKYGLIAEEASTAADEPAQEELPKAKKK